MIGITTDVQRTRTIKLGVSLYGKASLLRASSTIAERTFRIVSQQHGYSLAVPDVYGCTIWIVERQAVKHEGCLQAAVHIK